MTMDELVAGLPAAVVTRQDYYRLMRALGDHVEGHEFRVRNAAAELREAREAALAASGLLRRQKTLSGAP